MGQYYYAVSSLPHLYFDSETYPSTEEFFQLCCENLSEADLNIFKEIYQADSGETGNGFLRRWFSWNRSLRFELAVLRAQNLGMDFDGYQGIDKMTGTEELAREAYNQESPLTSEEVLERGRWGFLDELEVGHFFDLQKLLVYGLKLSILERKSRFNIDKGLENFKRIYGAVTEGKIGEQPE